MRRTFTLLFLLCAIHVFAQQSGSFIVGGDPDKFYPVTFIDGAWDQNTATVLEIGRSDVHLDSEWRGSMIARVRFHVNRWGSGSSFIDVDQFQSQQFIAGWWDATRNNGNYEAIIWLKGGGTTYYYKSNSTANPNVYDGVQNALPFAELNGPNHSYKTIIDTYVNPSGSSYQGTAYFNGTGTNSFLGNVTIGTSAVQKQLAVNGDIRARSVKVETANWPDYVFADKYSLMSLADLEKYIVTHRHLPDMPSAKEIETNGQDLGEINSKLLKSVEELTLRLIEKDKQLQQQQQRGDEQELRIQRLEAILSSSRKSK